MKNSSAMANKVSKNAKMINVFVIFQMIIQLIFSFFGATYLTIWTDANDTKSWYLYPKGEAAESVVEMWFLTFGFWFINLMYFVPISLLTSLEMISFIQGKYISWDMDIYDVDRDLPAKVQSVNLNEELGMVSYIFSDKTGTLTQNIMEFQKFSAGSYKYGIDKPIGVDYANGVTNVNF